MSCLSAKLALSIYTINSFLIRLFIHLICLNRLFKLTQLPKYQVSNISLKDQHTSLNAATFKLSSFIFLLLPFRYY